MVEVGLRAVGKGIVCGHLDVDDGTCGAVDIAECDGSLEVCSVVSEGQRLVATPDAERCFLTRQGDAVVTTCGHRLILTLARTDGHLKMVTLAHIRERCGGERCGIMLVFAIVFIECKGAVGCTGEYAQDDGLRRAREILQFAEVRDDTACLDIDGIFVHREAALIGLAALQHLARLVLEPLAFW